MTRQRRRRWLGALAAFAMIATAALAPLLAEPEKPSPPCGVQPFPNYPARGAAPEIAVWTASSGDQNWVPPSCMVWHGNSATLVVGLAGRFRNVPDADSVLARIGGISSLTKVRYWSVTDKRWNALFTNASALEGPNPNKLRGDFSAAELRKGDTLYFRAADNRSQDEAVSQLRVTGYEGGRIVVEVANVTPLHWYFLTFAAPGDIQTWYFLEREPDDWWRFYSLTRVLYASPLFAHLVPSASHTNRAVAMYRYMIGAPPDRDPPAVP